MMENGHNTTDLQNKEWRALANSTVCVIDFDRNQSGALIV
jgi:hypothetical protein